jgi:hypothetical protein
MAEQVGFEPTVRFHARQFSRLLPSTARPLLHGLPSKAASSKQRNEHVSARHTSACRSVERARPRILSIGVSLD